MTSTHLSERLSSSDSETEAMDPRGLSVSDVPLEERRIFQRRKSNSMEFTRANLPPPLFLQSTSWSSGVTSPRPKSLGTRSSAESPTSSMPTGTSHATGSSDMEYFSAGGKHRHTHSQSGSIVSPSTPSPASTPRATSPTQKDKNDAASKNNKHLSVGVRTGVYDPVLFNIMELSPKKFARQMALVDMSFFKKIDREELLSLSWNGPEKWKKAPNIVTFIQRFNNLTLWVSREILASQNVRRRAEKVEHFISIAKCCLECQNFNGLKSILGGLQCTPVYRLNKTWALIGRAKATLDSLAELMSTETNSEKYRKKLAKTKAPCVPYLGVHLSDITYAIEARNKAVDKTNINKNIEDLLTDLFSHRNGSYDYKEIPPALEFLSSPKFIEGLEPFYEDKNFQISLQLEPKEDSETLSPQKAAKQDPSRKSEQPDVGILDLVEGPHNDSLLPMALQPNKLNHSNSDSENSTGSDDDLNGKTTFFTAHHRESLSYAVCRRGILVRKDVTINFVRAKNRSWKRYLTVLRPGNLMFYKDKNGEQSLTQSPLTQVDITEDSFVSVAHDYKKRKYVIRFLPERGTEMFLEAESEVSMTEWVAAIEKVIQDKRNPQGDLIHLDADIN